MAAGAANAARSTPTGDFGSARDYVHHSKTLAPCIEQRWQELGYEHFSAYVTGLIRYDLLLLGPHKYFNGDTCKCEAQGAVIQQPRSAPCMAAGAAIRAHGRTRRANGEGVSRSGSEGGTHLPRAEDQRIRRPRVIRFRTRRRDVRSHRHVARVGVEAERGVRGRKRRGSQRR